MYLVVCTYPNFSINKMLQRAIPIIYRQYIKYLQAENIMNFMWKCPQIAIFSIYFSKFSLGGMPPDPLVPACWEVCFAHLYPRD